MKVAMALAQSTHNANNHHAAAGVAELGFDAFEALEGIRRDELVVAAAEDNFGDNSEGTAAKDNYNDKTTNDSDGSDGNDGNDGNDGSWGRVGARGTPSSSRTIGVEMRSPRRV